VSNSELFFYCLIFFLAGIVIGNFFFLENFYLFCLVLILFFSSLILFHYKLFFYVLIITTAFVFGWWRFIFSLPDCSQMNNICHYNSQKLELIGTITQVFDSFNNQRLEISATKIKNSQIILSGKVQTTIGLFPRFNVGDQVLINCKLQGLTEIKQTSFVKYLSSRKIYSVCWNPEIVLLNMTGKNNLSILGLIRNFLATKINLTLSEPTASLMRGMILGDSSGIPKYLKDRFSRLGLTHIIAISGSHIAIICSILLSCFLAVNISRPRAFWPIFWLIVFYVILVGAPASAVRSAIMSLMVIFSQKIGRLSRSKNILASAAALMALENPQIIMNDIGFQLSFAAVWGLVYITPIIRKYFFIFPDFLQLRDIITTTCAAQLSTLPLILFNFGNFSFISFFANLLILPIIPLLTVLGLIQVISASLSLFLGKIIGFPVWLICVYWLEISKWLDNFIFSNWNLQQIGLLGMIVFYLFIFGIVWFNKKMI